MVELVPRSTLVAREGGDLVARPERLPPVLAGASTPAVEERVRRFLSSLAEIFETWVARRKSPHTQRAYRQDVMAFVGWMGLEWPRQAVELLTVSVVAVQAFRDSMVKNQAAPKTVNRRLCSLASFYRYVRESAIELRLPVNVPNPAHAQFIPRESSDPVEETSALSISAARHLMALVVGDDQVALRDRAMVKLFLYSGVRIGTVCRVRVEDFRQEEDVATLRVNEKGGRRRTIGLHFAAAQAVAEYIAGAGLVKGPLFRQRLGSRSRKLGGGGLTTRAVYAILDVYLRQLPGAIQVFEGKDGAARSRCVYTPHSLRATVATVLLDAGLDIRKVQELLGHRMVTTTQVYDKRRRGPKESASHEIPF